MWQSYAPGAKFVGGLMESRGGIIVLSFIVKDTANYESTSSRIDSCSERCTTPKCEPDFPTFLAGLAITNTNLDESPAITQ